MAHILVVEDDMNNALVFEAILKRLGGHEVEITEDVDVIFEQCRSGSIDLVVMDVSLTKSFYEGKKVNGLEITQVLRSDEACKDIPILLATAHAMKGDKERFLTTSGAEDYITKPIMDHHKFIGKVSALLEKKEEKENSTEKENTV